MRQLCVTLLAHIFLTPTSCSIHLEVRLHFCRRIVRLWTGQSSGRLVSQFSNHPELSGKIYFVPAFFIDPSTFTQFANAMDGEFNARFIFEMAKDI